MKNVALIFAEEALFGIFTPISFLTEANLQKAIGHLENGTCNFVYIALDHFNEEDKKTAEKYLSKYVNNLQPRLQSRIFISASTMPYMEMFMAYISQISGEVGIDILARVAERIRIEQGINAGADDFHVLRRQGSSVPLVFIRGRAIC